MIGTPAVVGAMTSWSPIMSPATGMLFIAGFIMVVDGAMTVAGGAIVVLIIGSDHADCIGIVLYDGIEYIGAA